MTNFNLPNIAPPRLKNILKYVLLSVVLVILLGVAFFGAQWFSNSLGGMFLYVYQASLQNSMGSVNASNQNFATSQDSIPWRNWSVDNLELEAVSAISVEVILNEQENADQPVGDLKFSKSGVKSQQRLLFNKNEDKKLPVASLTKLMTALVVLDRYDLSKKITVSPMAMAQEGEQGDLQLGQELSVENLLYIMLMESSNRAAYALAEAIGEPQFIFLMNNYARDMGLQNTHFEDTSGLNANSYSTAKDLVSLSEYLFSHYPLFREIISKKEYHLYMPDGSLHHTLINTNKILLEDGIIGGKTGFTKEALGCFMVIQRGERPGSFLVYIILGSNDRFGQMQNLMHWVSSAYSW